MVEHCASGDTQWPGKSPRGAEEEPRQRPLPLPGRAVPNGAGTRPGRGRSWGWAGGRRGGRSAESRPARAGGAGGPAPLTLRSVSADEPAARSAPAAAGPGLPEVGVSLEDLLAPSSPSHPAPPSDPARPRSPDPAWDVKREHDVRKPKELPAGGQKKQRLGEQSERAGRPRQEEAPGGKEGPRPAPGPRPPGGAPGTGTGTGARRAVVAPGPWKVPGSDRLQGALRPGASAASR